MGDDGIQIVLPNGDRIKHDMCSHSMNQTEVRLKLGLDVNGNGWQVYTKMDVGNVSAFTGQWNVPSAPSKDGQILYTFTGLQNIDWVPPEKDPDEPFDIIQPVLQYGRTPAGGGAYWGVASWYVTLKAGAIHSELLRVEPDHIIFGNMTQTGEDQWFINSVDMTSTATRNNTSLIVSKSILKSQPWAYVTLEVYDVESCEQYPPSGTQMNYTNMQLYKGKDDISINFVIGTDGQSPPICDASISIPKSNDVSITF